MAETDVKKVVPKFEEIVDIHELFAVNGPLRSPDSPVLNEGSLTDEKTVPVFESFNLHDILTNSDGGLSAQVKQDEEEGSHFAPLTLDGNPNSPVNDVPFSEAGPSQAPSTFYCALCQSDIPTTVHHLQISPDLAHKKALRQLLLMKYLISKVDEALRTDPSYICRRHVVREILPTAKSAVQSSLFLSQERPLLICQDLAKVGQVPFHFKKREVTRGTRAPLTEEQREAKRRKDRERRQRNRECRGGNRAMIEPPTQTADTGQEDRTERRKRYLREYMKMYRTNGGFKKQMESLSATQEQCSSRESAVKNTVELPAGKEERTEHFDTYAGTSEQLENTSTVNEMVAMPSEEFNEVVTAIDDPSGIECFDGHAEGFVPPEDLFSGERNDGIQDEKLYISTFDDSQPSRSHAETPGTSHHAVISQKCQDPPSEEFCEVVTAIDDPSNTECSDAHAEGFVPPENLFSVERNGGTQDEKIYIPTFDDSQPSTSHAETPGTSHAVISQKCQAPSTFFCALCQSDIPTTVYQLLILPDPAYKTTIRQLLLMKYGVSLVDQTLSCQKSSTICRWHVEQEVNQTLERTASGNEGNTVPPIQITAKQRKAERRREQAAVRRAAEKKAKLEAKLQEKEEKTNGKKEEKEIEVKQKERERTRLRRQKIYEDKEAHEEWKRKNRERQREVRQAQKEALENAADKEAEGIRMAYEERIRKDRERHRLRRQREDPQVQAERRARRAANQRLRRMNHDEAERLRNNERSRQYKARLTEEQRQEYRRQKREDYQLRRMNETEEEKEERRKRMREYMREYMKNEKNRELQRQRSRAYMSIEENRKRQYERSRLYEERRKLENTGKASKQKRSPKTPSDSSGEVTESEEWREEMSSHESATEEREMNASSEEKEITETVPDGHQIGE